METAFLMKYSSWLKGSRDGFLAWQYVLTLLHYSVLVLRVERIRANRDRFRDAVSLETDGGKSCRVDLFCLLNVKSKLSRMIEVMVLKPT